MNLEMLFGIKNSARLSLGNFLQTQGTQHQSHHGVHVTWKHPFYVFVSLDASFITSVERKRDQTW